MKLSFPDANPRARIEPFGQLSTSVNYFIGNDPANWQTNVPVYHGVRYRELYPGIDLEISGAGGKWEWQLVCAGGPCVPEALGQVRLRVDGAELLTPSGVKPAAVAPERPAG
ncbi:hypothetical protein [Chloroflexus sp.]|uniref:DUF7948 domain-containing protein n=1 Tax=Chloroflexus sp. TaxID=1904827 RepID=UPI002ACEBF43|nr:hypothetical protein [Chloroflexus sp.]